MSRIKKHNNDGGGQLVRLGKIKIGEKRKNNNGKEYPVSTDYFIATGEYKDKFYQIYDKPKKLPIIFISNDINQVCNERYEIRDNSGRLIASGDGENWQVWNSTIKDYEAIKSNVHDMETRYGSADATLTLRFLLPEIHGIVGVWQFDTKAKASSIPQIRDTFDSIKNMTGTVVGMPFDLIVDKVQSQKPGAKNVYPVVKLVANFSIENMTALKEYASSQTNQFELLSDPKFKALIQGSQQVEQSNNDILLLEENIGLDAILTDLEMIQTLDQLNQVYNSVESYGNFDKAEKKIIWENIKKTGNRIGAKFNQTIDLFEI